MSQKTNNKSQRRNVVKKSAEEIQNEYFKKMSLKEKLKFTSDLIELCFKLNSLAQFYDAERITHRNS